MDDLESLLPYFERELNHLRRDMLRFEREHPEAAARLSMSGGQTTDPHVERMLQQAAWLNARAARRIDDHYPDFTVPIIETVFPAYLQAVPSCSIACVNVEGLFDGLTQTISMPHGTELEHRPSLCRFTTAWDLTLAPLAVARAQFSPPTITPASSAGEVPYDTAGILSIEFASPGRDLTPNSELLPRTLRIYLHADRPLAGALVDAMLLRPPTAFVEADGARRWQALERAPASAVGFDRKQALVGPLQRDPQAAIRLLIEYAAFPQKFRFIDIDFAALLRTAGPCNRLTLHLPVVGPAANASAIQELRQLSADHLRLFCTPVVNLFKTDATAVDVKADTTTYPVALPNSEKAPAVIRSIDSVRMMHGPEGGKPGAEIPPHRSFQHWSPVGVFWLRERDEWVAQEFTKCDAAITLVDVDNRPVVPNATKLAIELTCTNGDLSDKLSFGAAEGDLHSETQNLDGAVSMLIGPSASTLPPQDDESLWRLVSALSPNSVSLFASALTELQSLLYQCGKSSSPDATRYIAGIIRLDCVRIRRMMSVEPIPMPILVPGIQVALTIDETAFAGHALHTFALLMEQYFLRYAGQDCIELIVRSRKGAELYRGEALLGPQELSFV